MLSTMNTIISFALCALSVASTGAKEEGALRRLGLSEFQRVLRTSLDSELVRIADGSQSSTQKANLPDQRNLHTERKSNVRRRAAIEDMSAELQGSPSTSESFTDIVWHGLVQHAWDRAQTIKREERISVTSNQEEALPCPFLVCKRGRTQQNSDNGSSVQDITALFDTQYEDSVLVSSSHDETCVILTTTAPKAHQVVDNQEAIENDGSESLVAVPLLDIAKIHAGTIAEVSSNGWSVPYNEHAAQKVSNNMNETEAINQWERMIVVDFAPGLGGMKEESELLAVVNNMMGDIQDMGEVGWLRSMEQEDAEEYYVDESLVGVPALSDMFSLTSSLSSINDVQRNGNARVEFWHDSMKNGIESEHACNEMFSTLFVKPRAGYYGYDLVLNPSDGPPPQEYESSASNPACVTSLIAALSAHPYVLSVKANFPVYHGWDVAQKLDSY